MTWAYGLVFLGIFVLVALPLVALSADSSQSPRQVRAALDSALAGEQKKSLETLEDLRRSSKFSSIPWINRKLRGMQLAPHLQRTLNQARLDWSVGRLLAMCAICFAIPAYVAYLRFSDTLIALGAGAALCLAPYLWVRRKRALRFDRFEAGLPDALDLVVSALRAGHSLIMATGMVAREAPEPVGSEFRACFDEQNYGLDLKSALENLIERVPIQDLRIVTTAIMIQKESGGNLAEVLDKTAHSIRERFRLKRQVRTHTAQGRMTGWILTLLPLVVGALMFFLNPRMMSILWTDPLGIKLMWGAIGMTCIGGLIIRSIVNMDV